MESTKNSYHPTQPNRWWWKTKRRLFGITSAVSIAIAALSMVHPASATQECALRDVAMTHLEKNYREHVVGRGLTGDGRGMVEFLTGGEGTWTLIVTDVRGHSCVIASGGAWMKLAPRPGQTS